MKILLICLLAVQIASVACAYRSRRHGKSSSSASFLLRKVCVEVAGMKGKVAELEEEVAGLKEENLELKEKVAGLEEENSVIKQPG